jgi:Fe-S cluster biogenesis protein NfuA
MSNVSKLILILLISLILLNCGAFSVSRSILAKSFPDGPLVTTTLYPSHRARRHATLLLYSTQEDQSQVEEGQVFKIRRGDDEYRDFTLNNVDDVLNEIRPYLIQDGGNVTIANIDTDTRSVYVHLVGACGSCPSSTTTMKMGIERVLKENFKDLGTVESVLPPTIDMQVLQDTLQVSLSLFFSSSLHHRIYLRVLLTSPPSCLTPHNPPPPPPLF